MTMTTAARPRRWLGAALLLVTAAFTASQARGSSGLDDLIAIHRAEAMPSAHAMLRADPAAAEWLDAPAASGRWTRFVGKRTAAGAGCPLRQKPGSSFHKYVVDRSGTRGQSFGSEVEPASSNLVGAIEQAPAARS